MNSLVTADDIQKLADENVDNIRKFLKEAGDGASGFDLLEEFMELMMRYSAAIREVRTKFEVLNDEFSLRNSRNPIESITSRVKKPMSIFEKLRRMGEPVTLQKIEECLNDVAGIRVICPFIDDIYSVAEMLARQDDITVLRVKDYIRKPKPNGYRSYHMIVQVPVFFPEISAELKSCAETIAATDARMLAIRKRIEALERRKKDGDDEAFSLK